MALLPVPLAHVCRYHRNSIFAPSRYPSSTRQERHLSSIVLNSNRELELQLQLAGQNWVTSSPPIRCKCRRHLHWRNNKSGCVQGTGPRCSSPEWFRKARLLPVGPCRNRELSG